jgi:L-ascorbate metabolism protein UlaG (beta-lactamase superfamily)
MYHGGKWKFPFGTAKMVIAHHGSGMSGPDGRLIYMGNPGGWVFTIGEKTIYHAGDTSIFLDMELIGRTHAIDLAFLPIGDNFTMGIDEAIEALKLLKPKAVVPIHYDTWDLIKVDAEEFAAKTRDLGVQPHVLGAGGSIEL